MKKIKQILTAALLFCASFAFADTNLVKLGHITVTDGVAQYKNATVTGSGSIYAIYANVSKGALITTGSIGSPAYTDTLSEHQTGIWTYGSTGITTSQAQSYIQSLAFNYEEGMTITIELDPNKTTIPSGVTVTQFTPEPAKILSDKAGTAYTGKTVSNSGGTPHYYMFVPYSTTALANQDTKWTDAYDKAKTYTFLGMKGYLATITSAAEDKVLDAITSKGGWAGAARTTTTDITKFDTDNSSNLSYGGEASACTWNWVCGPEAGYGVRTSTTVATKTPVEKNYTEYAKWYGTSQPDGSGSGNNIEAYFQVHFGEGLTWNDLPVSYGYHNTYGYLIHGYFVEFSDYKKVSGYTEPAAVALLAGQVYNTTKGQDYSSIADAVADATSGDSLSLMADQVVLNQDTSGKTIVINTNGYKITGSFAVSDGSLTINSEADKLDLTALTVSGGKFVTDKIKCATVTVTGGTLNITGTKDTVTLAKAEVGGGAFTLNGATASEVSVTGGTFTVDGLVKIPSLTLAKGNKVTFGSNADNGSEITLSSTLQAGVITENFKGTLGQAINFPEDVADYLLVKTKKGELKVKQHKSAW